MTRIRHLTLLLSGVLPLQFQVSGFSAVDLRGALSHLSFSPPPQTEGLANVDIPLRRDEGDVSIGAYVAQPTSKTSSSSRLPLILLLHEFFGLSRSICDKADALAEEIAAVVVCPDMFRGERSTFIPKCIWLALTTPQDRVNSDLEDTLEFIKQNHLVADTNRLAVMGFCFGGGKAITFTTERRPDAATVVCYGKPLTDVAVLSKLDKPLCGVFGSQDVQFPLKLLEEFQQALEEAKVEADIRIYDGVGHAFWSDMEQVHRGDQPQLDAYRQVTDFLKRVLVTKS